MTLRGVRLDGVSECFQVGRLILFRAANSYREPSEIDQLFFEFAREQAKVPASQSVVIVADWRPFAVMSSEAAARMIECLQSSPYPRIERGGALFSPSLKLPALQYTRILRESQSPHMRTFHEADSLQAWLDEVLGPIERAALRRFLQPELT